MPHLDMKIVLAIGCVAGGLFYLAVVVGWRKDEIAFGPFIEAVLSGGALLGAAHLGYAALHPEHLVHLVDLEGKPVSLEGIRVELGDWHFYEIFAAAFFFFTFSVWLMFRACSKQHD